MNQVRSGGSLGTNQVNEAERTYAKVLPRQKWRHRDLRNSRWFEWEEKTMRDKVTLEA